MSELLIERATAVIDADCQRRAECMDGVRSPPCVCEAKALAVLNLARESIARRLAEHLRQWDMGS